MPNHLFTRAGGIWADNTDLLHAEMADIDAKTVDSFSSTGGVYALASNWIVGGSPGVGIEFDVQLDTADLVTHGTLTVDDSLFQNGQAFFADDATFSGPNFTVTSAIMEFGDSTADLFVFNAHGNFQGQVNFNDDVFCNDVLHVSGELFGADVSLSGFLDANGNCFLGGSGFVEFLGDVTARTVIGFADNGKVKWRNKVIAAPGNQSVVAALFDTVLIPASVLAAGNGITIDDTGAQDGMRIEFTTEDAATAGIHVATPGGFAVPLQSASGLYQTCAFQRIAGTWRIASLGLRA